MNVSAILKGVAVVAGIVAAVLWLKASVTEISTGDAQSSGRTSIAGVDVLSTLRVQAKWNKWAAIATAIAVALQCVADLA